jgi:hypothetical protein
MVRQAHHERKNFYWSHMSGSNFRARPEFVEGCAPLKTFDHKSE